MPVMHVSGEYEEGVTMQEEQAGAYEGSRELVEQRETVERRLFLWADELRSIANEGLHWSTDNPYNMERYRRILRLAAAMFAVQDTRDVDAIERLFREHPRHMAPYPCGDAAVFDDAGRILLIRRRDNGLWAMPGGTLEVGETPAEGACREAWEETGVAVEALALSGVYDSRLCGNQSPYHLYLFVFICRPLDPDQTARVTAETLDVGWYAEAGLATLPLDPDHVRRIPDAFKRRRGELADAVFDIPGGTAP
jgi:ADP-ribose pyrophosphatase YjhB (NUDIX family)